METTDNRSSVATRGATSERTPKFIAAGALTISLFAGADGVLAISLTAATLAVAEVTRARFGMRSLRTSASRSANSQFESVASHTP